MRIDSLLMIALAIFVAYQLPHAPRTNTGVDKKTPTFMSATDSPTVDTTWTNKDTPAHVEPRLYQTTWVLSNGAQVGKTGSMMYLLNNHGERVSDGYHSIKPTPSGYIAQTGSVMFDLCPDGKVFKPSKSVLEGTALQGVLPPQSS